MSNPTKKTLALGLTLTRKHKRNRPLNHEIKKIKKNKKNKNMTKKQIFEKKIKKNKNMTKKTHF